jgi:hypothetical protein
VWLSAWLALGVPKYGGRKVRREVRRGSFSMIREIHTSCDVSGYLLQSDIPLFAICSPLLLSCKSKSFLTLQSIGTHSKFHKRRASYMRSRQAGIEPADYELLFYTRM